MPLTPTIKVDGDLGTERFIGTMTINGSVKNIYEKEYSGDITITSSQNTATIDPDTAKSFIELAGIFTTGNGGEIVASPYEAWSGSAFSRRYTFTKVATTGLVASFFDTNTSNQGSGKYVCRARYYK